MGKFAVVEGLFSGMHQNAYKMMTLNGIYHYDHNQENRTKIYVYEQIINLIILFDSNG